MKKKENAKKKNFSASNKINLTDRSLYFHYYIRGRVMHL